MLAVLFNPLRPGGISGRNDYCTLLIGFGLERDDFCNAAVPASYRWTA